MPYLSAEEHSVQMHARDLYLAMPGAPVVPRVNGCPMWGDVEGNEHWNFCEAIARAIVAQSKEQANA